MTDFPPPEGFSGYESRGYGEDSAKSYERECTAYEAALLEADCAAFAAFAAQQRADEAALRDF